jgi:DNA-directed RNA polymerase beta subunit
MEELAMKGDLLSDIRESYELYRTKTVHDDIQYLVSLLRETFKDPLTAKSYVGELYESGYKREVKKQRDAYYPVEVAFYESREPIEVLRIPSLDDLGIFNIHGERRFLPMRLSPAEGLSYSDKKQILQMTFPHRSISIEAKERLMKVKYGANRVSLHILVKAMLLDSGIDLDLCDYFSNAYIVTPLLGIAGKTDENIEDQMAKLNILDEYKKDYYRLGLTRRILNSMLTIDRALHRTLSRPVLNYPAGTRVTSDILKDMKKNLVNEVYVRSVPNLAGYTPKMIEFKLIPKGTENSALLKEVVPQYRDYNYIPEDIKGNWILNDVRLDKETLQTLANLGFKELQCSATPKAPLYKYRFEQEIIGNYTCRLGDVLGTNLPAGRSADEHVYFYNNRKLEPCLPENITAHDLMAVMSLLGYIRENKDDNPLLDKDAGFLKRVDSVNELFSESFREVAKDFVRKCKRKLDHAIRTRSLSYEEFKGLSVMWTKHLWNKNYTRSAETSNPLDTISQVCQIQTAIQTEAVEEMRQIAMGYYGRICPYETPAGPKLGITNVKALGARLRDGLLETPYQKVLKDNNGDITGLATNLTWMNASMEALYCIGDRLSLEKGADGRFRHKRVLARVRGANNEIVTEMVKLSRLDYVNAYGEQHCSPATAMIPFAASDEAARVSMAATMMKQSILLQSSEIPRVYTSMYRTCFENSTAYAVRARKDGIVDGLPVGRILLTYDDGTQEDINIAETHVTAKSVNFLNFRVKVGDRFREGDLLVDSAIMSGGIYSPGVNMMIAYIADGWEYEDAVVASSSAANKLTSVSATDVKHTIKRSSGYSIGVGRENYNKYIPEDGVITYARRINRNDTRREEREAIVARKTGGILYDIVRIEDDQDKVKYKCQLLSFNKLQVGDKIIGRHSNKGVISTIREDSKMPVFNNGVPVEMLFNPCGVPSRMNVGQNFEAYLGFVAMLLDINIQSNAFNGASRQEIVMLMQYVYDLANNDNADAVCSRYPLIPKSVHELAKRRHDSIKEWRGCFYPDGTAPLWNPKTGKHYENPVTFGVAYVLKLEHEVGSKIHVRAGMLEEEYKAVSKQPTEGASRGGGQRMGEMEIVAMAAYGANAVLEETLNAASDNIQARENMTLDCIGKTDLKTLGRSYPESVYQLMYFLEAVGVKMEGTEGELPDVSYERSKSRVNMDVRSLAVRNDKPSLDMRRVLRNGGSL